MDCTVVILVPHERFPGGVLLTLIADLEARGVPFGVASLARGRCHGSGGVRVTAERSVRELDPLPAAIIVLDGEGHALAHSPTVRRLLLRAAHSRSILCGIGHGVIALATAQLLRGHLVAGDEAIAPRLRHEGAIPIAEPVVVASNIVTALERAATALCDELVEFRGVFDSPFGV